MISMLAVGRDAEPEVGALIYELFNATSPRGRGGCGKALVDVLQRRHINLDGLTVPTLVIGSERDRLTPLVQSRRIARPRPTWLTSSCCPVGTARCWNAPPKSTGSCARSPNLRRQPADQLIRAGIALSDLSGGPLPGAHRPVEKAGPLVGGFGAGPVDRSDRAA